MNSVIRFTNPFNSFYKQFIVTLFGVSISLSVWATNEPRPNDLNGVIRGTVSITDKQGNKLEDHSNVVVFVDGLSAQQKTLVQRSIPKISHKGLQFNPRVLPVARGASVNFLNDDRVFHNVFSLSKAKTFDLGIYPSGSEKFVRFDQPGLVKVYCNIHPNMISNILVLNNLLFSKTNIDGKFEIKNVPAGNFTLRVWYELGDEVNKKVTIQENEHLIENFTVTNTKHVKKHKNKFGMPYRKKY